VAIWPEACSQFTAQAMFNCEDSSDEEYCARVSAALESKLAFGPSDLEEPLPHKSYPTFYVDGCDDDPFCDDFEFTDLPCQVLQTSDPTSPQATPTKPPSTSASEIRSESSSRCAANDEGDGWNSEPESSLPLASSSDGEYCLCHGNTPW
jgi:hypothetical protein